MYIVYIYNYMTLTQSIIFQINFKEYYYKNK